MKHEFSHEKPNGLKPMWEGQFDLFHWSEYLLGMPMPLFVITSIKDNGKTNACLHSWTTFTGDKNAQYCIIGGINLERGHTIQTILKNNEFCLNFPNQMIYDKCLKTIENNFDEVDEVLESGLTLEESVSIKAPRIKECFLNLECTLEWIKPLYEGSNQGVLCGRIKHISMDDEYFDFSKKGLYNKTGYMFNIRSHINPITGEGKEEKIGYIKLFNDKG